MNPRKTYYVLIHVLSTGEVLMKGVKNVRRMICYISGPFY